MPRITAAERKRQEAEAHDRAVHAALAWPEEPCPQPWSEQMVYDAAWAVHGRPDDPVRAWTYNVYDKRVTYGSFNSYCHDPHGGRPRSKGQGGPWFTTETEARLALRWAVCCGMAKTLHSLIEGEDKAVAREDA